MGITMRPHTAPSESSKALNPLASHNESGTVSSSVKATISLRAGLQPRLRAAAGPCGPGEAMYCMWFPALMTSTALARKTASVPALGRSSTTIISKRPGADCWCASASRQRSRRRGRPQVGTTTLTTGTGSEARAAVVSFKRIDDSIRSVGIGTCGKVGESGSRNEKQLLFQYLYGPLQTRRAYFGEYGQFLRGHR